MYFERAEQQKRLAYMFHEFEKLQGPFLKYPKYIHITGPLGSGKTTFVKHFAEKHNGFYFSCRNLTADMAIRLLTERLSELTETEITAKGWQDIITTSAVNRAHFNSVLILDDVDLLLQDDEFQEMLLYTASRNIPRRLFLIVVSRQMKFDEVFLDYEDRETFYLRKMSIEMRYYAIADIVKLFPKAGAENQLCLFAMTGGIPALVHALPSDIDAIEALDCCLSSDIYRTFAEQVFRALFRAPESYMTLCYAIALDKHRNSEIARFAGYAPNKCDKYLKALIEGGIIKKNKKTGSYDFANPYYDFWFKYVYPGKKAPAPEEAEQALKQRAEEGYKQACMNYAYYKLARIYTVGHLKETSVLRGDDPKTKIGNVVLEFDSDEGFCKATIQFYDESYLGKKDLAWILDEIVLTYRPYMDTVFLFVRGRYAEGIIREFKKRHAFDHLYVITPKGLRY